MMDAAEQALSPHAHVVIIGKHRPPDPQEPTRVVRLSRSGATCAIEHSVAEKSVFGCLLEMQLKEESNTNKDISRRGKDRPAQLAEKRVAIARNLYLTRAELSKAAPSCEHWPGQLPVRYLLCQLSGLHSEMPTALDRHDERRRRKCLVFGDGAGCPRAGADYRAGAIGRWQA